MFMESETEVEILGDVTPPKQLESIIPNRIQINVHRQEKQHNKSIFKKPTINLQ